MKGGETAVTRPAEPTCTLASAEGVKQSPKPNDPHPSQAAN